MSSFVEADLVDPLDDGSRTRLATVNDLQSTLLLRSKYLPQEWPTWLELAGVPLIDHRSGPIFDSTLLAVEAAKAGLGVALGQLPFVAAELERRELVVPFDITIRQEMGWHLIYPSAARWFRKLRPSATGSCRK